jgi:hypothetical protein
MLMIVYGYSSLAVFTFLFIFSPRLNLFQLFYALHDSDIIAKTFINKVEIIIAIRHSLKQFLVCLVHPLILQMEESLNIN